MSVTELPKVILALQKALEWMMERPTRSEGKDATRETQSL